MWTQFLVGGGGYGRDDGRVVQRRTRPGCVDASGLGPQSDLAELVGGHHPGEDRVRVGPADANLDEGVRVASTKSLGRIGLPSLVIASAAFWSAVTWSRIRSRYDEATPEVVMSRLSSQGPEQQVVDVTSNIRGRSVGTGHTPRAPDHPIVSRDDAPHDRACGRGREDWRPKGLEPTEDC
jgi:hypothetical protein